MEPPEVILIRFNTGVHEGPHGNGHLGDLPLLTVDPDGTATTITWAPRPTLQQLKRTSIMVHAKGDNFSDTPVSLGGGGGRLACGILQ